MRVKKVKIGIKSFEEVLEGVKDAMKKIERGEKVKKRSGLRQYSGPILRRTI